jgi:tRNA(adenine34) deaminase
VESLFNVLTHPLLNHQPQVIGGILEDRCAAVVRDFFADCRAKEK